MNVEEKNENVEEKNFFLFDIEPGEKKFIPQVSNDINWTGMLMVFIACAFSLYASKNNSNSKAATIKQFPAAVCVGAQDTQLQTKRLLTGLANQAENGFYTMRSSGTALAAPVKEPGDKVAAQQLQVDGSALSPKVEVLNGSDKSKKTSGD